MQRIVIKAFAKINLYLDVGDKLPDGYHTIDSVMQSVDLCDILVISKTKEAGVRLSCSAPDVPLDAHNTAYVAAAAYFAALGAEQCGAAIYIDKKIPMQAGLAGGSADAAGVLLGLNAMFGNMVSREALCEIGEKIGADVPFCIKGGTMRAQGKGERLTSLRPIIGCRFILIKPKPGMDTARAYHLYDDASKGFPRMDIRGMLTAVRAGETREASRCLYNVFEHVYTLEGVNQAKDILLENGALSAVMTGTGSAVAGIFEDTPDFARAVEKCASISKGINAVSFSAGPVICGTEIIYME